MRRLVVLSLLLLTSVAVADYEQALRLARARLDIAHDVALAKLYSRGPIEDLARERQVVENVRREAVKRGVDPNLATRFFAAQIDASKIAQRAWQAKWAREGAPFTPRPNLAKSIRPKLDALTPQMIEALKDFRPPKNAMPKATKYAPKERWLGKAWYVGIVPLTKVHPMWFGFGP